MLPDEEAVRAVQRWHASRALRDAVDSVTIAPAGEPRRHTAQIRVEGRPVAVEASAETPSLAVRRAFDRLLCEAGDMHRPRASSAQLTLHA
jgi:hypothetical protein